jgi:hypothetical protein
MTTGNGSRPEGTEDERDEAPASLVDALLVYVEPLASAAHAIVIGDAESVVAERLLDLGARSVLVFDPDPARAANAAHDAPRGVTVRALVDELDVRDGAFDLAVVPDLAELNDPHGIIGRLHRAIASSGALVAMGRARVAGDEDEDTPFLAELGAATLDYGALYELFAMQFDEVSLSGVVPFTGVVFAELGGEDDEPPAVSVDTRLAPNSAPSVFVVVAAQRSDRTRAALDPYAIVQVSPEEPSYVTADPTLEADLVALQLKGDLLTAQLEEARDRLAVADVRGSEVLSRLERATIERDGALTRGMELEAVLAASQQTMATIERRLLEAEQGMLERDDRIAVLNADMDERRSSETPFLGVPASFDLSALVTRAERAEAALAVAVAELALAHQSGETTIHLNANIGDVRGRAERAEAALAAVVGELENTVSLNSGLGEFRARAERAEAALAIHIQDLAHVAEGHALETASYEEQLRDRARVVAALERELLRREELVKELVASLEESREGLSNGVVFQAATPMPVAPVERGADRAATDEVARLSRKLDALAAEVARREGELVARAWRITELENENARLAAVVSQPSTPATGGAPRASSSEPSGELEVELSRARDELDALRKALTQEHAARVAAESGEELARVRSELARQAALLEQIRGRANDPA